MKSIDITLQRTYQETAKRNIVRHPANLSNILEKTIRRKKKKIRGRGQNLKTTDP